MCNTANKNMALSPGSLNLEPVTRTDTKKDNVIMRPQSVFSIFSAEEVLEGPPEIFPQAFKKELNIALDQGAVERQMLVVVC